MEESPFEPLPSPTPLPRLRIHHFFLLTTVFAVLMSSYLGLLHFIRSVIPDSMPDLLDDLSFFIVLGMFSLSASVSITLLGLFWRRQQIPFPSQPGHWIAIHSSVNWVCEFTLSYLAFFFYTEFESETFFWTTTPITFVTYSFLSVLWIKAFRQESARLWKWIWAAIAVKSLFLAGSALFSIGLHSIGYSVIDTLNFFAYFTPMYAGILLVLLPYYAVLISFPVAVFFDYRNQRHYHWSHWFVLALTYISTVATTIYCHLNF